MPPVFYLVTKVSRREPWASSLQTQRVLGAGQPVAQVPSIPRSRPLTRELPAICDGGCLPPAVLLRVRSLVCSCLFMI